MPGHVTPRQSVPGNRSLQPTARHQCEHPRVQILPRDEEHPGLLNPVLLSAERDRQGYGGRGHTGSQENGGSQENEHRGAFL